MSNAKVKDIGISAEIERHADRLTVARVVVHLESGDRVFSGCSFRMPTDKNNPRIGDDLALGRALDRAARALLKEGNGLVKHADDMAVRRHRIHGLKRLATAAAAKTPFAKREPEVLGVESVR